MKKVALGPEKDVPSWNWVGFDTSRELSKYYDIATFASFDRIPDCDVVLVIKQRPPDGFVKAAHAKNTKVVYCPIDFYQTSRQFHQDGSFFQSCDMVLSHCERQIPLLRKYNRESHFVEHNNKYMLPEIADYKEKGYILWIGGCQYIAYLVKWLREHPIREPIKILADIDNDRARTAASVFATEIGLNLKIPANAKSIAGCEVYQWSERLQYEMMAEAKAAIDIKLTDNFNQYYKPPTKAQKYVASGIPFAVNSDSYSSEYFRTRGFDVAEPTSKKWFTKEYWEATVEFAKELRVSTSIETVGSKYRELIERLSITPPLKTAGLVAPN